MKTIYDQLDTEYINEDEGIYTMGDDILGTFANGNFTQGVEDMREHCISTEDLISYLEEKAEEYGMNIDDMYYGHFDRSFFSSLGRI